MNPLAPWLLVFDLDGTLIDSSLDLCISVNAAMAHVGSPQLSQKEITRYIGDGAAMLVQRALSTRVAVNGSLTSKGSQDQRFERAFAFFLEFYREHKLDNTRPYDGVLPALHTLRSQHPELPMAVLTNKPVRPSKAICDALGLTPFFFANYGGDSFSTKKPDPQGLLTLMQQATQIWQARGTDPTQCLATGVIMIGDSEADMLTGRRAHVRTLGCRYGLAPQSLELEQTDSFCDNPAEWPDLIARLYTSP